MTTRSSRRGGTTAAEIFAELQADPEYQRQKAEAAAEQAEFERVLTLAEAPLVAELRAAGFDVTSAWDLVNTSEPYPQALPILIEHLERGGYPDRVMEGIARALAVKPSVVYWQRLRERFERAGGADERSGIAAAMSAAATRAQLDDMIQILQDPSWGENAAFFIRDVLRFGGDRGAELVQSLVDDPLLGKEATALLKRRKRP